MGAEHLLEVPLILSLNFKSNKQTLSFQFVKPKHAGKTKFTKRILFTQHNAKIVP